MAEITTVFSETRQYKDVSSTFGVNPVTHDVIAATNAEAVKQALRMILLTRTGEVPFFPNFGSRIYRLLFEPIDPVTTILLKTEIAATITAFEPRVQLRQLDVVPSDDEHTYRVTLLFNLVNQVQPITLSLFLTRLR
tara:strand:+ start:2633 stop:3043 length:411 start_codon:yes stop_codon:yes gene_type:complete